MPWGIALAQADVIDDNPFPLLAGCMISAQQGYRMPAIFATVFCDLPPSIVPRMLLTPPQNHTSNLKLDFRTSVRVGSATYKGGREGGAGDRGLQEERLNLKILDGHTDPSLSPFHSGTIGLVRPTYQRSFWGWVSFKLSQPSVRSFPDLMFEAERILQHGVVWRRP